MNTENTDFVEANGWVLYDGDCHWCVGMARRARALLASRHFALLPLQTPGVAERLKLTDPELLAEMRLLKRDGRVLGGAEAVLEICRHYWFARPIYHLGKIPGLARLAQGVYRWMARHRHCAGGACLVPRPAVGSRPGRFFSFLPLLILPVAAFGFRTQMSSWVFMWAMALALYAGCKWLTCCKARERGVKPSLARGLGYLLLWPGMDAAEFLNSENIPTKPRLVEWVPPLVKILLGTILLGILAGWVFPNQPLLGGWIGMTGIILILHFGLFHLGALLWRTAGVKATPVMQKPLLARSLTEFWGGRWNTAFNELAFRLAFRPLRRQVNPAAAILLVFGGSGLIHELVISLPARAGYGLPTGYFLIQGLGVITERTAFARRIGLARGAGGWLFTMLVTAGPAFWLFHPPFIQHVILPMLKAIGAI